MSNEKHGILLILSGFSGAGKGTVVSRLLEKYPQRYRLSISATTREPREGEKDGVHYFFISREKFKAMIEQDQFLEYAEYVSNYYGTPKKFVQEQLDAGYDVILEIEEQGAFQVKKKMPEALLIFLAPPSAEELERRLRGRQTESEEVIQSRLARAWEEAQNVDGYDYFMINDNADECAERIHDLIESERRRVCFCESEIIQIRSDLEKYRKQ